MGSHGLAETALTAVPAAGWRVGVVTGLFALVVAVVSVADVVTERRNVLTKLNVLIKLNVLGTIVHEAGHASISILTGGGVYRIEITSPDSGVTSFWLPSKLSSIATSAAGYAMPPLAGLGAAALLHRGHVTAVLSFTVVTMALLLFIARDVLTFVIIALVGALAFAIARWSPGWLQVWAGYTEAWLLLTSEIAGVAVLAACRLRGRRPGNEDDAKDLADETHIPAFVWITGWFTLLGWVLWHGVPLLWP